MIGPTPKPVATGLKPIAEVNGGQAR